MHLMLHNELLFDTACWPLQLRSTIDDVVRSLCSEDVVSIHQWARVLVHERGT